MKKVIFALLFVVLACPAIARNCSSRGATRDTKTGTTAGQWSVTYLQGLGDHAHLVFSYINEGHQPNHYRDGLAGQIWGVHPYSISSCPWLLASAFAYAIQSHRSERCL